MNSRRAQVEMTFHWIYVLLAGVVILLFFVGIVVKQKTVAEQRLSTDLTLILESIFTAAGVSESTKIALATSGFADETLFFRCLDGATEYGFVGKGSPITDTVTPLFALEYLKGTQLFLWSLPYHLPYKVADLLFITSPSVKYVLLGDTAQVDEFIKEAQTEAETHFSLAYEHVPSLDSLSVNPNLIIRVVDFSGTAVQEGKFLPPALQTLDNTAVSAVVFDSSLSSASFYQKKGTKWKLEGTAKIFSLGGERDAVRYAAIFAGSKTMFDCGMQKALKRATLVTETYLGKMSEITAAPLSTEGSCPIYLTGLEQMLQRHHALLQACTALYPENCGEAVASAVEIEQVNKRLQDGCLPLY